MSDNPEPVEETSPPSPQSPLVEADPQSLDEIFKSIDQKLMLNLPREITDFEIDAVVDYYWSKREIFMKDLAAGKTARVAASTNRLANQTPQQKARAALKNLQL